MTTSAIETPKELLTLGMEARAYTERTNGLLWHTEVRAIDAGWRVVRADTLQNIRVTYPPDCFIVGALLMVIKQEGRNVGVSYAVKARGESW